jgi:hypothetical protein
MLGGDREPSIRFTKDENGQTRYSIEHPYEMSDGRLHENLDAIASSVVLRPSVTPPRAKLLAARYYLTRLRLWIRNQAAALFYIDAFVQALRSATFVLQNVGHGIEGFAEWYESKRVELSGDDLLRELVVARNVSQKQGLTLVGFGPATIVRQFANGDWKVEAGEPAIEIDGLAIPDPIDAFDRALSTIERVVEEAHHKGFVRIEQRQVTASLEFLRQMTDGSWEQFEP